MAEQKVLSATGNQMVCEAFRQADPDVVCAYPITPQTTIVEGFAKVVANGGVHTEFVTVESEHSSMSACIGSAAAGARTFTATSSQGLAYMWEELHIAAGMRLPIVMANANRALSAPINIHGDHSDVMGARDTGWLMFFAETAQEAYDNTLVAIRVAEDHRVLLPAMTTLDGFITTHAMERCELMDDATVKEFLGQRDPVYPLLDIDNPVGHGMFADQDSYFELHKAERAAADGSRPVIKEIGDEWAKICGRPFDFVDAWGCEDADYIIVTVGSSAGNARHVARELREQGKKVGVARIRVFRPFPYEELVDAIKGAKAIAVLDRSENFSGQFAPVGLEVATALYNAKLSIPIKDYVYGLGGHDVTTGQMEQVFGDLEKLAAGSIDGKLEYLGNR